MATKIPDNALSTERISRRSTTLLLGTNKSHSVCRHRSSTRRFPKCPVPPTTRTFLWTIWPAILLKRLSFEQPESQDESGQCLFFTGSSLLRFGRRLLRTLLRWRV